MLRPLWNVTDLVTRDCVTVTVTRWLFRKIFIEDDGGMVFGRPRQGHSATPWRWCMTRDDVDALVLCDDLKLTRAGKLTAYARRRVEAVRPKIRFRVF